MKTNLEKWRSWLLMILALTMVLMVRADNPCDDSTYDDPWTCTAEGGISSVGTLNRTSISVCTGGSVSAPFFSVNPTFNDGSKSSYEHHTCDTYLDGPISSGVTYVPANLRFTPTTGGWPAITGPFNTPGTYTYIAQADGIALGGVCDDIVGFTLATVTVTVTNSLPVIIGQPQSQTASIGNDTTFTVSGTACPFILGYQWRFNVTNVIANATNASLTITNVQMTNAGNYTVVLSDPSGSVTSSVAVLTVVSPVCTNLTGIVAWWPAENNANDIVGTNNGTPTGGVTYTNGKVNQAFVLNGSTSYIPVAASPSLNIGTNSFTIEGWIRPNASIGDGGPIIEWDSSSNDGLQLWVLSGFYLYANLKDTGNTSHQVMSASGAINTNRLQHVALTYNRSSGAALLYVNGTIVATNNFGTITPQTTYPLNIGRRTGQPIGNGDTFNGLIDELTVYNRALSQSEILAVYNTSSAGKCTGIAAVGPTNITTCSGQTVTLSVAASGCSPLSYLWKLGTNVLAGQTNSSLTVSNTYSGNSGTYSVIVSGLCGSRTNSATLTVLTNLSVAGPIDLSVCAGSTAVFNVTAFGSGPFTYRWSFGTNLLSAQTNSSLTITNVGPANAGTYAITVSGACGTVTQSAVLRTFAITSQPANQAVTYGQSATFSVGTAGYSTPSYQWRRNGVNIPGATGSSYTVVQPTVSQSGDYYDVITWSPYCSQTSSSATLTVSRAPLLVSADNQTRYYGSTNSPLTWTATGFVFGETSAALTGAPTLSTTAATNSVVGSYTISISAGTLAGTNYSLSFTNGTLTVAKAPLTIIADDKARLYGAVNPVLTWRALGFVNGETTNVLSGAPQLSTSAATNSAVGSYAIVITQNTLTCTNYAFAFSNGTLSVTPASINVSANSKIKLTGTPNPTLTGSLTGVRNNDNITSTYNTPATTFSPAGSYPIIPTLIDPSGKLPNYSVLSVNGTLTVTDSPPYIVTPPPSTMTTNAGSTLSLTVVAGGTAPINYAWLFNGNAIAGATGSNYTKILAATDGGNYSVRVSDAAGSITSAPTVVTVIVPAAIATQPASQTVAQGTNVNFTVVASGSGTITYQWYTNGTALTNGTKYSGVTSSSLWVTNVSGVDAVTYSVKVTNSGGSMTSGGALLTVVKMSRIIVNGSNPEINTTNVVAAGTPITFRAIPFSTPGGTNFPTGYPVWSNAPAGATFANGSPTLTLTNPAAGLYQFSAWSGSSVTNFSLLSVNTTDSDYDGVGDWQEILDGTDPNNPNSVLPRLMGSWRFDTTNWAGIQGQTPVTLTNLNLVVGVVSNAVSFNTNKQASLVYAEANSAIANINCRRGSVSFWFRPDWSSATAGTGPTNEARLIEFGNKGTTNGCWGLYINAKGTNLYFCSQTNASSVARITTNVNATINWSSNYWHFIALTYSSNKVRLFIDGFPVATNSVGVTNWPGLSVRANGFCVGSSRDGTNQCRGRIDNLDTCDYDRDDDDIRNQYVTTCFSAMDTELVIDQSGSMGDPGSPGHTKLQDAQQASTNFVNSLNFNLDQAGVVSFSSASTNRQTLTNNLAAIVKAITNLIAGGSTSIYSGITNAQAELISARHHSLSLPMMVILTDGSNNPATQDPGTIQAATAAKNAGTRILAVGLGAGADTNLLQQLASTTNLFYYATNSSQLNSIYGLIAGFLCRSTNLSPAVQITSPASNQVFNFPAPIPIKATASDPQKSMTSVSFYAGSVFLGQDRNPVSNLLYSVTWTNGTPGTYTLTAVASNSFGLSTTSAPVPIIINGAPIINITNQTLIWNESSTSISTTLASSSDDGRPYNTLTNGWSVLASNGPVVFGNVTNAASSVTFSNFGTYVLNLAAGDGAAATSSNATVLIKRRPFVSITVPTNTASVDSSVGVAINASAYDLDGFVLTNGVLFLDVFNGATNTLGTATYSGNSGITNFFGFEWTNNPSAGAHTLYAIATDNDSLTKTSAPVNITVYQAVFVSINPTNPSVCAGATVTLTANATGSAPLTYLWSKGGFPMNVTTTSITLTNVSVTDSDLYSVQVTNLFGSASAASRLTVSPPTVAIGPINTNALNNQTVILSTIASGGGTLTYVWRKNGAVVTGQTGSSLTIANAGSGDAGTYTVEVTGSCGSVTNSAKLAIDLPPTIYIVMPANNAQEPALATIRLNSIAQDDGVVTNVVYLSNGVAFASSTVSPYSVVVPNVHGSTNVFQAFAYDDKGQTGSSPLVTNIVIKQAPTVQIFIPHSNDVFVTSGNVFIGAQASDTDGIVTGVEFRISGGSLGTVTTAVSNNLYYFNWTNAPQTAFTNLYAIATDNDGLTGTSSVPITVQAGCAFPGVSNLVLSASEVAGGATLNGTVILSNTAPAGGETINLATTNSFVAIPATVYIPSGQRSNSFSIASGFVNVTNTAIINASYHGQFAQTAALLVDPIGNGTSNALQHCGPMDVVFVIDTTYSMNNTLYSVAQSLTNTLNEIIAASGGDYRLALVTFDGSSANNIYNTYVSGDYVNVMQTLAATNAATIAPMISSLVVGDGGNGPECSDEALNTVINLLSEGDVSRNQLGSFSTPFRSNARKLIIMATDAAPGSFYDYYADLFADVIASNDVAWTAEAAAKGIEISTVNMTNYGWPQRDQIMHYYPDATGGIYTETGDGSGAGQAIQNIIAQCGSSQGNVIFVRDDNIRQYVPVTISNSMSGGAASTAAQFDMQSISGPVTGARLLRAGLSQASAGSTFDVEIGGAATNGQFDSYGVLLTNVNLAGAAPYSYEWALQDSLFSTIQRQLGSSCFLELTDRLSSVCGTGYSFTDQPEQFWPVERNSLLVSITMDSAIPQGRCRDFVLMGNDSPVNGVWDITLRGAVIGSSGSPNGWNVEDDHTAFGGSIVTVPSGALQDADYEVRVLEPDWDTGRSVRFSVVQSNSLPTAPVLLPLVFSTNMASSGATITLTAALDAPAPFGDAYVVLNGSGFTNLPMWIVIPTGQRSVSTNLQVSPSATATAQIKASYNGYRIAKSQVVSGCTSPAAPVIQSIGTNEFGVNMVWLPVAGATSYNVGRSTNSTGVFPLLFTGLTTTNFTDTTGLPLVTYYYQIVTLSNWCQSAAAQTNFTTPYPFLAPPPFIIPFGGVFNEGVSLLITNYTPGSTNFYTTNGVTPDLNSGNFAGGLVLTLSNSATIRAFSTNFNYNLPSSLVTAKFIVVPATPIYCGSFVTNSISAAKAFSTVLGNGFYCSRFIFTNDPVNIGELVTVTASSSDFDTFLFLKDTSTNVLQWNDDYLTNSSDSQIAFRVQTNTTYIFEVTSYSPLEIGNFTLSVSCQDTAELNVLTNAYPVLTNGIALPVGGKIDFGLIPLSAIVTNWVTVTNSGKGDLVISNIAVYPTAATNSGNGFSISPTNTMTIPTGGVTNLAVTLSSSVLGSFDGYLIFTNNDAGSGTMPPENPFWAEVAGNVGAQPGQPLVSIYYPTNGTVVPLTNDIITNVVVEIDAVAVDINGIQKVEFYTNGVIFQTLTSAPYTTYWTNPPAGLQTIIAKAYDLPQPTHTNQASVTISVGAPTLTLSPTNACVGLSNTTFTATATLRNLTNGLVTGSNVVFTVSGAHNFSVTSTTTNGLATLVYTGTNAGLDQIAATAVVNGLPAQSGIISKEWAMPISCGNSYAGNLTNTDGFSIACGCAVPSHYTDFYSVTGLAGDTVTLTMTSSNFSTYMFVMDTNCTKLSATVQALNTNDTRIVYTLPSNGTYVVEATSAEIFKTGSYVLTATCGAPPAAPQMAVLVSGTNMPDYGLLNLGVTTNNLTRSSVITITNTGGAPLNITGWSLYGGLSSIFSLTPSPVAILQPGSSTNITVQFSAGVSGQYSDALVFTNNDPNQNPFVVNITAISNPNAAPPTVAITSPTNNSQFIAPGLIPISATATANGTGLTITNVAFVFTTAQGTFLIGNVTNAPYNITWSEPVAGNYSIQAVAYDSQGSLSASAPVSVSLYPSILNHPPVALNDHPLVPANSANNILDVLTNDYDPDGDTLTITKIIPPSSPGPHGAATIVDNGKHISYTPVPFYSSPDTNSPADGFSYQVSDGKGGTAIAGVYVVVFASKQPTIHIANPPSGTTLTAGTVTNVTVSLGPPESLPYIARVDYFIGEDRIGSVTNAPFTVFPWYVRGNDCGCGLKARVTDIFGQFSEDAATYNIVPPANAPTPYALIDNPAELPLDVMEGPSTKTAVVEDGLLVVTGSVYQVTNTGSTTITNAAEYKILIKSTDGLVLRDTGWLPTALIRNGMLNTNDLTTLQNDKYVLELLVRNDYQTATKDVPFILNSNFKMGVFTISQQDLVIPAGGAPLSVIRTYNSINPNLGDFGYSWTYSLNDLNVTFDEIRVPQCPLDVFDEGPAYGGNKFSLRVGGARDVTLTLPDGRRTTFYYNEVAGQCSQGDEADLCAFPSYYVPPGIHYALQPVGENGDDIGGYDVFLHIWQKGGGETAHEAFDFPAFMLTDTADGTQYFIKRDYQGEFAFLPGDCGGDSSDFFGDPTDSNFYVKAYSGAHLEWIKLASGEKIVINPPTSGPTGSQFSVDYLAANGNTNRSIYFQRDVQGQILAIMDPTSGPNGLAVVKYEYDANTNLSRVEHLVNRNPATYTTNTYLYESARFPHYLTKILDGRGVPAARNLYDDSGKLIGMIDSTGKTNLFSYNPGSQSETTFDRMGNPTTFFYDTRGNITAEIDALGHLTQNTFDNNNNITSTTDPLTNTTYFAYDGNGNRTQMVDPMGQTNLYSYDVNGHVLTHTDPAGNLVQNNYDSYGNLTQTAQYDAQGNLIQQSSSSYVNGHLSQTLNGNGQLTASFTYDVSGNMTNKTDADGFSYTYGYDANGKQVTKSVTAKRLDGTVVTVTTTNNYDPQGHTTIVTDQTTNTASVTFNENGMLDTMVDRFGNTNHHTYDPQGNQIQLIFANGATTKTAYDANGRAVLTTDLNGISGTRIQYDPIGRKTAIIRATNVVINIVPDPGNPGSMMSEIASMGVPYSTNSMTYYDNGWLKTRTTPDGQTTSYTYWPNGQTETIKDPLGHTTFYSYDNAGRQTLVWDAANHSTRFLYDAMGRVVSTIFNDNSSISNVFNNVGQRVAAVDQAGQVTQYGYSVSDELTNIIEPAVPDPEHGNNPTNAVWSYGHDLQGRLTVVTDPYQRSTTNVIDEFSRQVAEELPMGQTNLPIVYNSYGQVSKQYDFLGQRKEFYYDQYGRLKAKFLFTNGVTEDPYEAVCYLYNRLNQLTNVIERYGIDASTNSCGGYFALVRPDFGRRLRTASNPFAVLTEYAPKWGAPLLVVVSSFYLLMMFPAGRRFRKLWTEFYLHGGWRLEQFSLEASRRQLRLPSLFWKTVSIITIMVMACDDPSWNGLFTAHAECVYPSNSSTLTTRYTYYTYDFDGHLTQANSPEGVINYSYDLATGRLTGTCTTNSETQYSYDALGRLATVNVVKRNGQLLNPQEVTTYGYDAVGNRTSIQLPNGILAVYQHDSLNRLTNLTYQAGITNLSSYSYTLDQTGRKTGAVEVLRQEDNTYLTNVLTWQYDGLHRLTNEVNISTSPDGNYAYTNAYTYDLVGNRLQKTHIGPTTETIAYTYNSNDELLQENSSINGLKTYLYDNNGSLTNITAGSTDTSYVYNPAKKLTSVSVNGTLIASYVYNDHGIRVSSMVNGSATHYLTDENNRTGYAQVVEELPAVGGPANVSYVIGDEVLAQATAAGPSYFLEDGHGNNRQLVSGTSIEDHYCYDAYGNVQTGTGPLHVSSTTAESAPTSKLYCGEQYDSSLHMYNLRARYYDTQAGRFSQRDAFPANDADPQTMHRYLYAEGDPANFSDPSGNQIGVLDVLSAVAIISTVVTIGFKVLNAVNDLKALGQLIDVNYLLNQIPEMEPEFLIIYSYFSFAMALKIIGDLGSIALSIVKDILSSYSAAAGAIFIVADAFSSDDEDSNGGDTDATLAHNETEFNSQNTVADLARGVAFEKRVLVKGIAKTAITVNNRLRIPDEINYALKELTEVKSLKTLRWSKQLKDYFAYCKDFKNADGTVGLTMKVVADASVLKKESSVFLKMTKELGIIVEKL